MNQTIQSIKEVDEKLGDNLSMKIEEAKSSFNEQIQKINTQQTKKPMSDDGNPKQEFA
jgi:hypothetical protein